MKDQDHLDPPAPASAATVASADRIADRLAAAAVPTAITVATMDKEAGPLLFTDLLAHELASSHHVLMRFAAAANTIMDWPNRRPRPGAEAPPAIKPTAAHLAGARAAASAGRVLDQVRLGLIAWGQRRPASAADEHWIGFYSVSDQLTEADFNRCLQEARAAHGSAPDAGGDEEPALSDRARGKLERGGRRAAELVEAAGAGILAARVAAANGARFMRGLFTDELAAAHALKLRLDGGSLSALDRAIEAQIEPVAACRLAESAARMGDRFRRGLTALAEFDKGPSGKPRKYHVYSVKPAKSDDSAKDSGSAG
ncbi:MAG: hypothetical protein ACREEE_12985, partial [Dongiaceae bacterium]